jgi:hypothetical protein
MITYFIDRRVTVTTKNKAAPIGEDTRPKDWVKLGLSPSTVVEEMDSTKVLRSKMVQALEDYKAAYDNSEALTPEEDPELQRLYYAYADLYNEYMDRLDRVEEYV